MLGVDFDAMTLFIGVFCALIGVLYLADLAWLTILRICSKLFKRG